MSHVLIVDDDANTREALAALASHEGFTVATAGSVAEARIQLVRQRPDVVLMDLRLPDGSGMELYWDRPKEKWPRTPGGELAMFTRALDLDGLLKEAPQAGG